MARRVSVVGIMCFGMRVKAVAVGASMGAVVITRMTLEFPRLSCLFLRSRWDYTD